MMPYVSCTFTGFLRQLGRCLESSKNDQNIGISPGALISHFGIIKSPRNHKKPSKSQIDLIVLPKGLGAIIAIVLSNLLGTH